MSESSIGGSDAMALPELPRYPMPNDRSPDEQAKFERAAEVFRAQITTAVTSGDDGRVAQVARRLLGACPDGLKQMCQLVHAGVSPAVPAGREVLFEVGRHALRAGDASLASEIGSFLEREFATNDKTGPHGPHLLALARESADPDDAWHWLSQAVSRYRRRAVEVPGELRELKARLVRSGSPPSDGAQPASSTPAPERVARVRASSPQVPTSEQGKRVRRRRERAHRPRRAVIDREDLIGTVPDGVLQVEEDELNFTVRYAKAKRVRQVSLRVRERQLRVAVRLLVRAKERGRVPPTQVLDSLAAGVSDAKSRSQAVSDAVYRARRSIMHPLGVPNGWSWSDEDGLRWTSR